MLQNDKVTDNTQQLRWIGVLCDNLSLLFKDRADVLVASDLCWYPKEGDPEVRTTPNVMVVFGRPPGNRESYKEWEEGGVPVTVVFEVLSPATSYLELDDKREFYQDHGVEECYLYCPDSNRLKVFVRQGEDLLWVRQVDGFVSPRLSIRFDLSGPGLTIHLPNGSRFLNCEELGAARALAQVYCVEAETARARAELAWTKSECMATRMAELSRKARRRQATAEELDELEQLENECSPPPP